jgi:hypothetical protein
MNLLSRTLVVGVGAGVVAGCNGDARVEQLVVPLNSDVDALSGLVRAKAPGKVTVVARLVADSSSKGQWRIYK